MSNDFIHMKQVVDALSEKITEVRNSLDILIEMSETNADIALVFKMKRQKDLVEATGIHQATISNILTGHRRPSWGNAKKLAAATGTDVALWMEGTPEQIRAAVFESGEAA